MIQLAPREMSLNEAHAPSWERERAVYNETNGWCRLRRRRRPYSRWRTWTDCLIVFVSTEKKRRDLTVRCEYTVKKRGGRGEKRRGRLISGSSIVNQFFLSWCTCSGLRELRAGGLHLFRLPFLFFPFSAAVQFLKIFSSSRPRPTHTTATNSSIIKKRSIMARERGGPFCPLQEDRAELHTAVA